MTYALGAAFVTAFALTAAVEPLVIRALRRWEVLDRPGERSSHTVATPRGGGLAVLLGFVAGTAFAPRGRPIAAVVTALLAFGLIGGVEDLRGAGPLTRFCLQVVAAAAGVAVWSVGVSPSIRSIVAIAGVLLIVAYANAFNFMDGINGISAVQVIVAGAAYAVLSTRAGDTAYAVAALALVGCAAGFLPWNFPRASVFLGDAGSYAFGAVLMFLAVALWQRGERPESVAAPLLLYVVDTTLTLVRRVRRGETWYLPHRSHVYQRLTDLGWSHTQVTAFVALLIGGCAMLGVGSASATLPVRVVADATMVAALALYVCSPALLRRPAGGH